MERSRGPSPFVSKPSEGRWEARQKCVILCVVAVGMSGSGGGLIREKMMAGFQVSFPKNGWLWRPGDQASARDAAVPNRGSLLPFRVTTCRLTDGSFLEPPITWKCNGVNSGYYCKKFKPKLPLYFSILNPSPRCPVDTARAVNVDLGRNRKAGSNSSDRSYLPTYLPR